MPASNPAAYMRGYRKKNKILYNQQYKKWRATGSAKLKLKILTHYGNGVAACVKCSFNDIRALCLDHINGKAGKKKRGIPFYQELRKMGFPPGYQTLCANCNLIKLVVNKEYL